MHYVPFRLGDFCNYVIRHIFIFCIYNNFLWCKIRAWHSCRARDPRKASFVDLTAHHVTHSRVRSLSRSAARAHVREAIHMTDDLISRAVALRPGRKFPVRFARGTNSYVSIWFTTIDTFESLEKKKKIEERKIRTNRILSPK